MIKFNPDNKEELSYNEILGPAVEIKNKKEALLYLNDYTKYIQKWIDKNPDHSDGAAEDIAKSNIAYWAGYYSNDVRRRVEKLFLCEHPIFGSIAEEGSPTVKEAFECGKTKKTLKEIRNNEHKD